MGLSFGLVRYPFPLSRTGRYESNLLHDQRGLPDSLIGARSEDQSLFRSVPNYSITSDTATRST